MSSPLSADRPAAPLPERGSVEALITQARRLRGDVDAVRRGVRRDAADPRGRWQRALYELALHHLSDLDAHLAQLRDGPAPAPRSGSLIGRVGSAEWNLLTDEADWSGELYRILGLDPAATAPLSLDELPSRVLPADRPKLTAMVTDCLVDARPVDGEFRVVRPDGTVRTVHMMGEPVLDAAGSTASMWAVLRDVSELRRSQRVVSETRDSLHRRPRPAGDERRAATEPREAVPRSWRALLRFPARDRPGLDLAAAHLPAPGAPGDGAWYDACALAGDGTLLSVGELAGPAPDGAPATHLLLGALRGLAAAGTPAEDLPDLLGRLLDDTALPPPAGVLCCGYRPGTRTLTWAHDGHPAPLLFRDGTGRALSGRTRATLESGDLLLLHTRGLVPGRRGQDPRAARDRLLALAPRLADVRSARDGVRILTEEFGTPVREGDACLLVARVTA
ncbi:SpoIIE family protein phosphatase [Streptomyces sp. NPDC047725]|uniref:SpoIIE family protein phosphatase n=1 Tax=Streptomyces sp. NPDC047725 TaxID=3365487 RepID=UPI0037207A46